jgi:predicted RNase H-like nuclease (RuvC/YqgF family)
VDTGAQRARDSDRRKILEDELKKEEMRLAELRSEFNGGEPDRRGDERNYQRYLDRVQRLKDEIARSESSVSSLRREMAALKD